MDIISRVLPSLHVLTREKLPTDSKEWRQPGRYQVRHMMMVGEYHARTATRLASG